MTKVRFITENPPLTGRRWQPIAPSAEPVIRITREKLQTWAVLAIVALGFAFVAGVFAGIHHA